MVEVIEIQKIKERLEEIQKKGVKYINTVDYDRIKIILAKYTM